MNHARFIILASFFLLTRMSAQVASTLRTSVDPSAPTITSTTNRAPGHIYFAGNFEQAPSFTNIYISDVDSSGQPRWERVSPHNCSESVVEVDADPKSIYVAGKSIDTSTGIASGLIVRFTPEGNLIWRITITGGPINSVKCLPDGGIIAAGSNSVVRMDSTGAVRWDRCDSNANYQSVITDSSGHIYCIGSIFSPTLVSKGLITKSDSTGQVLWSKQYSNNGNPYAFTCATMADTTLYVAGYITWPEAQGGYFSALLLIHMDSAGVPLNWTMSSVATTQGFMAHSVAYTSFRTIAVAGNIYLVNGSGGSPFVGEFDEFSLSLIRGICLPMNNTNLCDMSMDVTGNTVYAGYCSSGPYDVYYGLMDYSWTPGCGFSSLFLNFSNPLLLAQNITVGTSVPFGYEIYGYTYPVSINWSACNNAVGIEETELPGITVFPDPAANYCSIRLPSASDKDVLVSITDVTGRTVRELTIPAGTTSTELNTSDLNEGMYFIFAENRFSGKFIVVR